MLYIYTFVSVDISILYYFSLFLKILNFIYSLLQMQELKSIPAHFFFKSTALTQQNILLPQLHFLLNAPIRNVMRLQVAGQNIFYNILS